MRRELWLIAAILVGFVSACAAEEDPADTFSTEHEELRKKSIAKNVTCLGADAPLTCDASWHFVYRSKANHPLMSVWGRDGDEVYAVGWQHPLFPKTARILHFNGSTWTEDYGGPNATLCGVDGDNSAHVVGTHGAFAIEIPGVGWDEQTPPTTNTLHDVLVLNPFRSLLVGDNGTLLSYRAWGKDRWRTLPSPTQSNLNAIWGTDGTAIVVGDNGTLLLYIPIVQIFLPLPSPTQQNLNDIWGTDGTAIVVGDNGTVLLKRHILLPTPWREVGPSGLNADLNAIWGTDGTAIVVGENGTILIGQIHNNTIQWTPGPQLTQENLTDVWGESLDNIFITTEDGSILRYSIR